MFCIPCTGELGNSDKPMGATKYIISLAPWSIIIYFAFSVIIDGFVNDKQQ